MTINDQSPTYNINSTISTLVSGEKISVAFGKIAKAISDLISHIQNKSNPHSITATQIGLGNVNNTADSAKPVSTAQATAIADAKATGTTAQTNLNSHTGNKSNPHSVTAAQVNAVAKTGDTMTGALNIKHKDGINIFRLAADMSNSNPEHKNQLSIMGNGNTVLNRWKLVNGAYTHQSGFYFGDKALQLYNASEGKTYEFYGTHNADLLATQIKTILQSGNVSMVKSVQRGVISIAARSASATATITSVNTSKSVVLFNGYSNAFKSNSGYPIIDDVRLELTNATTVTASRHSGSQGSYDGAAITIPYQVVEYY